MSTTYFGSEVAGFYSRKEAEEYIEKTLKCCMGWSEVIRKDNVTIYVESANGEDVVAQKVTFRSFKQQEGFEK